MRPARAFAPRARYPALACLVIGDICLGSAAVALVLSRNFFDSVNFGRRAAESLADPGVARYAANLIADRVEQRKPDLIAVRPILLATAETVVSSRPFRSVVEQAAVRAHRVALSEGSHRVILSLPDLNILVHEAVANANPALASRIPKSLDSTIAEVANGRIASALLRGARMGRALRVLWPALLTIAAGFYLLGLWLALDRRRAMAVAGGALILTGLVLVGVVAANPLSLWIHDAEQLGLARGLWRTYLRDLARLGLLLAGIGVLVAAGASSLLERIDPFDGITRFARRIATPPEMRSRRILWGVAAFVTGCLVLLNPVFAVACVGAVAGVCVAYMGARELFRVFVEAVDASALAAPRTPSGRRRIVTVAISALVLMCCGVWAFWGKPTPVTAVASAVTACNGFSQLCDRTMDQVVFPGAHNAMSNQEAPGWMFPHHEAGMAQMLRDGVRALLIDVHYGFAGGARIKTDMTAEPNAEKIKAAVGVEGYDAAMRIRERLIGVDESQRKAYFCHGFCELGAYAVEPALRDIRDFAVAHPDEVLILIVEDYITPQDLASAFDKSGLLALIYTDKPGPPWPTLRQLIESGKRILVFIESGRAGVPWLRPAFETFQETPYSFHKIEDFSCRANRGGDAGSLFQINHWIDTTPAPRASNAAIVNAYPFLLARAQKCSVERRHLPNIIAVDFYRTGDLFAVVNKLNGVADSGSNE